MLIYLSLKTDDVVPNYPRFDDTEQIYVRDDIVRHNAPLDLHFMNEAYGIASDMAKWYSCLESPSGWKILHYRCLIADELEWHASVCCIGLIP